MDIPSRYNTPLLKFIPLLGVMSAIGVLSHLPGNDLPDIGSFGADKLIHGLAYAEMALCAILALRKSTDHSLPPFRILMAWAICLTHGIFDEWHQSFIPGRTASGGDILADVIGAAMAIALWHSLAAKSLAKTKAQPSSIFNRDSRQIL